MSPLPLAALLLLAAAPAFSACLDAAQGRALTAKVRRATVRMRIVDHGGSGSGFFLRDSSGGNLVTAHHVVGKDSEGSCKNPSTAEPSLADRLNLSRLRSPDGRGFRFAVEPGRFDYGNDAVSTPAEGAEPLEPGDFPLRPGEQVLVAGYPGGGAYAAHVCVMAGYAESLRDPAQATYVLDCPRLRTDIAGMSGGPIVSLCSGKVIGVVSWQDYDEECPRQGDPRKVGSVILSAGRDGKAVFGAQSVVNGATCWDYSTGPRASLSLRKDCQVIPGYFNVSYGP